MKLRFQADNDLDQRIVTAVRRLEPAIDFQTAPALSLHGISDLEVLALTAQQGRILVSHDRQTLPDHFQQFIASQTSPGAIIVSRKLSIGRVAEMLYLLWAASEAEEYVNTIYNLP
ncbi:MAG: hypothetical protein V7641_1130 [Blastocatellia bacterium]